MTSVNDDEMGTIPLPGLTLEEEAYQIKILKMRAQAARQLHNYGRVYSDGTRIRGFLKPDKNGKIECDIHGRPYPPSPPSSGVAWKPSKKPESKIPPIKTPPVEASQTKTNTQVGKTPPGYKYIPKAAQAPLCSQGAPVKVLPTVSDGCQPSHKMAKTTKSNIIDDKKQDNTAKGNTALNNIKPEFKIKPNRAPCHQKINYGGCNDVKCRYEHDNSKIRWFKEHEPCMSLMNDGRCTYKACFYSHLEEDFDWYKKITHPCRDCGKYGSKRAHRCQFQAVPGKQNQIENVRSPKNSPPRTPSGRVSGKSTPKLYSRQKILEIQTPKIPTATLKQSVAKIPSRTENKYMLLSEESEEDDDVPLICERKKKKNKNFSIEEDSLVSLDAESESEAAGVGLPPTIPSKETNRSSSQSQESSDHEEVISIDTFVETDTKDEMILACPDTGRIGVSTRDNIRKKRSCRVKQKPTIDEPIPKSKPEDPAIRHFDLQDIQAGRTYTCVDKYGFIQNPNRWCCTSGKIPFRRVIKLEVVQVDTKIEPDLRPDNLSGPEIRHRRPQMAHLKMTIVDQVRIKCNKWFCRHRLPYNNFDKPRCEQWQDIKFRPWKHSPIFNYFCCCTRIEEPNTLPGEIVREKNMTVSMELLSQIMTHSNLTLVSSKTMLLTRLEAAAKNVGTMVFNRYLPENEQFLSQDTVIAATVIFRHYLESIQLLGFQPPEESVGIVLDTELQRQKCQETLNLREEQLWTFILGVTRTINSVDPSL
jgi:hypothetical protein